MQFSAIWSVLQFERKRTATTTRWLWWSILTFFPVALIGILRFFNREIMSYGLFVTTLFYLIPVVLCLLGQLLWATPVVQSELEGKTWSYLAIRPSGKLNVLFGKFLTSVSWTFSAALISLTLSIFVLLPKTQHQETKIVQSNLSSLVQKFDEQGNLELDRQGNPILERIPGMRSELRLFNRGEPTKGELFRLWSIMVLLSLFSCLNYGALFCLIGILAPRKAMVVAVAYTLLMEIGVGLIPAVVNELTIQHRMRGMLKELSDEKLQQSLANNILFQVDTSLWQHIGILILLFPFLLAVAAYILHQRELIASEDVN